MESLGTDEIIPVWQCPECIVPLAALVPVLLAGPKYERPLLSWVVRLFRLVGGGGGSFQHVDCVSVSLYRWTAGVGFARGGRGSSRDASDGATKSQAYEKKNGVPFYVSNGRFRFLE